MKTTTKPTKTNPELLRDLMQKHGLTQPNAAALCGVSVKAVESWLAPPGAANHRAMPARALDLLRLQLAASTKKKKKG